MFLSPTCKSFHELVPLLSSIFAPPPTQLAFHALVIANLLQFPAYARLFHPSKIPLGMGRHSHLSLPRSHSSLLKDSLAIISSGILP